MVSASQVKELLVPFGEVRSQSLSEWRGSIDLPKPVQKFYEEIGPLDVSIRGYGNDFDIPSLAGLWSLQEGYRWNALSGEPIPDWNADWLVLVTEGFDPFIVKGQSGTIWFANHGEGEWKFSEYFSDINTMVACIAQLGIIAISAGDDLTDEYSVIKEEHLELAQLKLSHLLKSQEKARETIGLLGWG
jgi:hypothetical protein